MNYQLLTDEFSHIASDVTAGAFLLVLIISIAFTTEKRREAAHLLASSMLILASILLRLLAFTINELPDDFMWDQAENLLPMASSNVVLLLSFLLCTLGVTEAAIYTIYTNGGRKRSRPGTGYAAAAIIIAAGTAGLAVTGNVNSIVAAILAQFIFLYIYIYRCCSEQVMRKFARASLAALITFGITMLFGPVRLTGLGLAVMLVILSEQYHHSITHELEESEEELTRGRLKLLAEQISPHYIYNSLQSVRDLCDSDPVRAKAAVDSFSDYLRGNLESLTSEDLIAFERELELTQAYLELEQLAGRGTFEVEYRLETTDFTLPPLVLQPVVENAVRYGVGADSRKDKIVIETIERPDRIIIRVIDEAHGSGNLTQQEKMRKSIGLSNVRERLEKQCGGTLELKQTDNMTTATIELPKLS